MHALAVGTATTVLTFALAGASAAQAPQASAESHTIKSPDAGKWMPVPDIFPKGAEMQVLHGDPAKGPADFYFRVPANYTFPWHFHTPIEKLFIDEGTLSYETRAGKKEELTQGDYVYIPARSPHRVTCSGNNQCLFFLASNGPFDINLVDENWKTTRSWRPEGAVGTSGKR